MSAIQVRLLSNVLRRKGVSDAVLLQTLHHASFSSLDELHDAIQRRIALNRMVADFAENGQVAVVEGGMDCDCVQYDGHVHTFSSNITEFWKAIDQMYYSAEGPIHWYVARISETKDVCSTSRDLAFEAYEDGHPHVVYA